MAVLKREGYAHYRRRVTSDDGDGGGGGDDGGRKLSKRAPKHRHPISSGTRPALNHRPLLIDRFYADGKTARTPTVRRRIPALPARKSLTTALGRQNESAARPRAAALQND
uniref:Uncharacterized protein n=1 Tax=Plectus sambesii TaxID=2011161 RepID=A0A914XHY5_9BILA